MARVRRRRDGLDPWRQLRRLRWAARDAAKEPGRAREVVGAALGKARRHPGALRGIAGDLFAAMRMLRAWTRGEYRQVSWKTVLLVLAGLIYFVNPLDVVPDFLGGVGLLDDVTVLTAMLSAVRRDLDRYRAWEAIHGPPAGSGRT